MPRREETRVTTALYQQSGGFLKSEGAPGFSHSLNLYRGCGFGHSACGSYCYAATFEGKSKQSKQEGQGWGDF
ncbi:MAG TPA: hypothetical protein VNL71_06495, partial [Chloroflexota bacterium]|nr:hypothetical protein [Chloroflexota bacterium]